MKTIALIVAGGNGKRIGNDIPKQYLKLANSPILRHTVQKFLNHPEVDAVKVVIGKGHEKLYEEALQGLGILPYSYGKSERQGSVLNGLKDLEQYSPETVLIHDGARPFVSNDIISEVITKLEDNKAIDVAFAVTDTIKEKDSKNTVDRSKLYRTQTPQGFDFKTILTLHEKYDGQSYTDDIALAVADRLDIALVKGSSHNIKITHPEDIQFGELLMNSQITTKIGMGYDVHKFTDKAVNDNTIPICGIQIPHDQELVAHSDGDVGLHAITDALLGTIANGDIGTHFPPSDPKWKGADSTVFLKHTNGLVQEKGGIINNVDVTIICERPKILEHKNQMRAKVAEVLAINIDQVSVKATTTEKLGFTGRKEGIAAQAVCSVSMPLNG